ncbi:MAG: glutamate--tRNA ligase [bacterium]|nr:glutamate--tRNA ligase [bacterium]
MSEVLRFAPSPTGSLHIGSARTAFFNWVYAKKIGARLLLRIEDTDVVRSKDTSLNAILEGLKWLGIDFVGAPVFQTQRLDIYNKYIKFLLEKKLAYKCYCTPQELETLRIKQLAMKKRPMYDRRCLEIRTEPQLQFVYRFLVPPNKKIIFDDLIKGTIEFNSYDIEDFVLLKSNGVPTYNFACVVDDKEMGITTVLRGDDHLVNTAKQILLYEAFGINPPKFGHFPLILGRDGTKLSKRHGATSIEEFRQMGIIPQALKNYLALLGWGTPDSQQFFESDQEIIDKFSIERCLKHPAIFDMDKLIWLNSQHIRKLTPYTIAELSLEFFKEKNIKPNFEVLIKAVELEKDKIKLLSDVPKLTDFFFNELEYDMESVKKVSSDKLTDILEKVVLEFEKLKNFNRADIESVLRSIASGFNLPTSKVFHPVRVAVSFRMQGPSLFEMLEVLGKYTVLNRIKNFINYIHARSN